nr:translation machinery-associated protein 64 [Quercus suber]
MFKKKPTIKPASPLRSSDRRKLADQIIEDYNLKPSSTSASDEQTAEQKAEATATHSALRSSLLPENVQSARFTTTHGPELKTASGTVYIGSHESGGDARILWFEVEKKMYPSVYTLWRNPDLVALLHTPEIVVGKLQGGADLMTPGLAGGPPFPARARKDAVVGIASTERPSVPVAVGVCEIDVSRLEKVQGAKGHAVENLHWAGDELWAYSSGGKVGLQPPEEIEGWMKVLGENGLVEQTADLGLEDGEEDGGVTLEDEHRSGSVANGDMKSSLAEVVDTSAADAKSLTQKEIDDSFRSAFLYGLHHHRTSQPGPKHGLAFPLTQSYIMSNLIQPFLPAFTPAQSQQLQIKKTSWKNLKKFVKSLDKERIVKSKDSNKDEVVILDVDFNDPVVADFKPYRLPKQETMAGTAQGRGDKAVEQIDSGDDAIGQKLQVLSLFRPTSKLGPLFADSPSGKQIFTAAEVREALTAFIEQENLVSETNKRLVKLNPVLGNAVFDGSGTLDQEVLAKGTVPRDALIDRVLHAMAPSYAIVRNDADPASVKAKAGAAPKVLITLETRGGNKTVTKVSSLEAYFVHPRLLADELRKVCAGSTSVEALAGGAKKHEKEVLEVMVQGPQKESVLKALAKRGVNARWVEGEGEMGALSHIGVSTRLSCVGRTKRPAHDTAMHPRLHIFHRRVQDLWADTGLDYMKTTTSLLHTWRSTPSSFHPASSCHLTTTTTFMPGDRSSVCRDASTKHRRRRGSLWRKGVVESWQWRHR